MKPELKKDIYNQVTDKIIADLERGELTWIMPWKAGRGDGRITRPLRHNGLAYRGINVLILWGAAIEAGYTCPHWMTYAQAKALGAQIRKGEKGTMVVYSGMMSRSGEADGEDGAREYDSQDTSEAEIEAGRRIPFLKTYTVFNVEQIDELPQHYFIKPEPETERVSEPLARIAKADDFFAATRADIRHGGSRAFYSGASDHVQMPSFESFKNPESYYATLAHELTHWTKHEGRLHRQFGGKTFGDEGYAREELVAELGAAFLCADLQLTPEPGIEHATYIKSWLTVLKKDAKAIFRAAAHAERAAGFLHGLQQGSNGQDHAGA